MDNLVCSEDKACYLCSMEENNVKQICLLLSFVLV